MTHDIFSNLFGDKGYLSKALAEFLWGNDIQLITKPSKNVKDFTISQADKFLLRKRAIIGSLNDELKNICKL